MNTYRIVLTNNSTSKIDNNTKMIVVNIKASNAIEAQKIAVNNHKFNGFSTVYNITLIKVD